jgi:hypothetical protein
VTTDRWLDETKNLLCSDEAEFICIRYVNNQNEIRWSKDSSRAVLETSLCCFRVGVWCVVGACKIIEFPVRKDIFRILYKIIFDALFLTLTDDGKQVCKFYAIQCYGPRPNNNVDALARFLLKEWYKLDCGLPIVLTHILVTVVCGRRYVTETEESRLL